MASADFSLPLLRQQAGLQRPSFKNKARSPRVMRTSFTLIPVAFTSTLSVSVSGFDDFGHLTQRIRLMHFLFVRPVFCRTGFLQIPPRGGHPCRQLAVPLTGPARDLHPQEVRPAGRTK
jgi:hypothetical protein